MKIPVLFPSFQIRDLQYCRYLELVPPVEEAVISPELPLALSLPVMTLPSLVKSAQMPMLSILNQN